MDLRLTGKRALICGGSSGLGRGVATALVAEGAHVALLSRDGERLKAAAEAMTGSGSASDTQGRVVWVRADLADHHGLLRAVDEAERELGGPIEILLNNTGGPAPSGVQGLDPDLWRAQFEAMVLSVFRLTDRMLPAMKAAGWGRVLNVASTSVVEPIANLGVSTALRASVAGWAKTLSTEVAPHGITVNTLLPGRIDTPRIDQIDASNAARMGIELDQARAASLTGIPMGRLGTPEEFGAVAAFLCSPLAAYVTGSLIRIDGGAVRAI